MVDMNKFFSTILDGAKDIARESLDGLVDQAENDTRAFLLASKADLEKWLKQLNAGQINKAQFENLVQGQEDLVQMHALTEAGVAAAALQRFREKLINLVIDAAFKALP
ncbi:MAG TPA: hypothetical protein VK522_04085 [Pseudolabrys sp.]|jgi:hypothetical protein|nr:hypothetical protein [Pseudolabrys sp.]